MGVHSRRCSERKNEAQGKVDLAEDRGMLKAGATTELEVRRVQKKHRPDLLFELDEILKD
jgi:hypothetical protein